jgi:hypothetical protein
MVVLRNSKITIGKAADVATVFQDLLTLEDKIDQDKEHFNVMHLTPTGGSSLWSWWQSEH